MKHGPLPQLRVEYNHSEAPIGISAPEIMRFDTDLLLYTGDLRDETIFPAIVTACNYHDRLVEMVRSAQEQLDLCDRALALEGTSLQSITIFNRGIDTLLAELEDEDENHS